MWAGIDGFNAASLPNDSDLIQAGISEGMTNPATGECNPGTFYVWPWWEILPAPETLITTWGNGTVATVNAGDQVTVTVLQVSWTMWSINLVDDTTGGSFTTEQAYSAPDVVRRMGYGGRVQYGSLSRNLSTSALLRDERRRVLRPRPVQQLRGDR